MSKKSQPQMPAPPDPAAVARAQTGSNISTAIANALLGNANTIGPNGRSTFAQTGMTAFTGPDGRIEIPQFTQSIELSPEQQQLLQQQNQLGQNVNALALGQTQRLQNVLSQPFSTAGLPQGGALPDDAPSYNALPAAPGLGRLGAGPQYAMGSTTFGDVTGPQRSVGPADYSQDRQRVEQALMSRINPQLDRDRSGLETKLINQGFVRGTQGFNDAMDEVSRQGTDARMQAILAGGQEQSRMAGLDLAQGQFANSAQQQAFEQARQRGLFGLGATAQNNQAAQLQFQDEAARLGQNNAATQWEYGTEADRTRYGDTMAQQQFGNRMNLAGARDTSRERAFQEQLALRNQPINEISALMSGGRVDIPQFAPYHPGTVNPTDIGGYQYNTAALNQQNYASQLAQQNAMMGGLFGLGSAAVLGGARYFSDRRLKRSVRDLGIRLANGLRLYAFRYVFECRERVGLMADEVAAIVPRALGQAGDFATVDYAVALEARP
jgi:hypothetical protein